MSTIWEKAYWVGLMDSMKKAWAGEGGKSHPQSINLNTRQDPGDLESPFPPGYAHADCDVFHQGGLQGASSTVGDMMTEQTQSSGQKKADAANNSLTEMAGGMS